MIKITLENGQTILADRLIGVAFRSDGKVFHIVDGPVDLVDVLYTKKSMQRQESDIVKTVMQHRQQGKGRRIHLPES